MRVCLQAQSQYLKCVYNLGVSGNQRVDLNEVPGEHLPWEPNCGLTPIAVQLFSLLKHPLTVGDQLLVAQLEKFRFCPHIHFELK